MHPIPIYRRYFGFVDISVSSKLLYPTQLHFLNFVLNKILTCQCFYKIIMIFVWCFYKNIGIGIVSSKNCIGASLIFTRHASGAANRLARRECVTGSLSGIATRDRADDATPMLLSRDFGVDATKRASTSWRFDSDWALANADRTAPLTVSDALLFGARGHSYPRERGRRTGDHGAERRLWLVRALTKARAV